MKYVLKRTLASRLGWRLAAPFRAQGAFVLMYHRINAGDGAFEGVSVDNFRAQMRWVKEHCTPVWPEDTLRACDGASRARPPVVVTFDDGYRDFHDHAYPILRELGIPSAVFLSTQFVDRGGMIWTEALEWAVLRSPRHQVELPWAPGTRASFDGEASRRAFVREAKAHLKASADADRRAWSAALIESLESPDPEATLGRQMLSWQEVRACAEGTCFGGHSHTHPILARMAPEAMQLEIRACRDRIAEETGRAPRLFAYPNGRACDFDAATREALTSNGFQLSFSTIPGVNGAGTDPLAIRRLHNWDFGAPDLAAFLERAR